MLSATKLAISIKLATAVGHFLCDLDLDFAQVYMAWVFWEGCGFQLQKLDEKVENRQFILKLVIQLQADTWLCTCDD